MEQPPDREKGGRGEENSVFPLCFSTRDRPRSIGMKSSETAPYATSGLKYRFLSPIESSWDSSLSLSLPPYTVKPPKCRPSLLGHGWHSRRPGVLLVTGRILLGVDASQVTKDPLASAPSNFLRRRSRFRNPPKPIYLEKPRPRLNGFSLGLH